MVKDHFWINDAGYLVEPEHCFEEIEVEAWQTFDFEANVTTGVAERDDETYFDLFLMKN